MKKFGPNFFNGLALDMLEHGDVEDEIEDTRDIPEFWFADGKGKPYLATDRRNVWCYERCLSEENRIIGKDVYDPGPWPYKEADYNAVQAGSANNAGSSALETI